MRQIVLSRRPQGKPLPNDFAIEHVTLDSPAAGEVLVKNLWLSVDPYMRLSMSGPEGLHGLTALGSVPAGGAVGRVTETNSPLLVKGDLVTTATLGWRDAYVAPAEQLSRVAAETKNVQRYLGLYGLTGITAYAGVRHVLKPRPGEVILISGAAGAVGSVAAQLARLDGAYVVATAGTDEKGRWLQQELGVDAFINYRSDDVRARLAQIAPGGLDMFFDNVGGAQLEIAIDAMKPKGRLALCGAIGLYDTANYRSGPANLFAAIEKHLTLTGFNAGFYFGEAPTIRAEFERLLQAGELKWHETIATGLENTAEIFCGMLRGENIGKTLVKLADDGDLG